MRKKGTDGTITYICIDTEDSVVRLVTSLRSSNSWESVGRPAHVAFTILVSEANPALQYFLATAYDPTYDFPCLLVAQVPPAYR